VHSANIFKVLKFSIQPFLDRRGFAIDINSLSQLVRAGRAVFYGFSSLNRFYINNFCNFCLKNNCVRHPNDTLSQWLNLVCDLICVSNLMYSDNNIYYTLTVVLSEIDVKLK